MYEEDGLFCSDRSSTDISGLDPSPMLFEKHRKMETRSTTKPLKINEEWDKEPFIRSNIEKEPLKERYTQLENVELIASHLAFEQQHVVAMVIKNHRSVFITGWWGTGKTLLLMVVIAALPRETAYTTATNVIPALQLRGSPLHSLADCSFIHPGESRGVVYSRVRCNGISIWGKWKVLLTG